MSSLQDELARRFKGSDFFRFADYWSPKQRAALTAKEPFKFTLGGNGSGKTTLGSWWLACGAIGWDPIAKEPVYREPNKRYNMYASGPGFDHVMHQMQPALRQWIPADLFIESKKDRMWVARDDSWAIYFKSVDQSAEKYQGAEIDRIWQDEEVKDQDVWSEMLARTFRRDGHIHCTMTAWSGTQWMHGWIFSPDYYPMDQKHIIQIPVYDNPYYSMCRCGRFEAEHDDDGQHPDCRTGFDSSAGKRKLERMKRQYHGIEYAIRVEGEYKLLAGNPVINPESREKHVAAREKVIPAYIDEETILRPLEDLEDPRAWLRIIRAPREGHRYVVGVDFGGGNPTGDYHAAPVLDFETGEIVAMLHDRTLSPRDAGMMCVRLCRFYNDAFLVPEANHHGVAAIDAIIDAGYMNFFTRTVVDQITKEPTEKMGWWTDKKSKPAAVDLMSHLVNNMVFLVMDPVIHGEMFHYTWLSQNKEGNHGIGAADRNAHDDTMTGLFLCAIGYQAMGGLVDDFKMNLDGPSVKANPVGPTVGDIFADDAINGLDLDVQDEIDQMYVQDVFDQEGR